MRNRLIHMYDDIDHNRVIDTVQNDFSDLRVSLDGFYRQNQEAMQRLDKEWEKREKPNLGVDFLEANVER